MMSFVRALIARTRTPLLESRKQISMTKPKKSGDEADQLERESRILAAIVALNQEIRQIEESGAVAPPNCWVKRYQAQGKLGRYWYYKLHAAQPIFISPSGKGKKTKYLHLGKAGSEAHVEAVMQLAKRGKIEGLQRAIDSLNSSLSDVSSAE